MPLDPELAKRIVAEGGASEEDAHIGLRCIVERVRVKGFDVYGDIELVYIDPGKRLDARLTGDAQVRLGDLGRQLRLAERACAKVPKKDDGPDSYRRRVEDIIERTCNLVRVAFLEGDAPQPINIGEGDSPGPTEWAIDGMDELEGLNGCFATEGAFKTYLAVYKAVCLQLGYPFLGRTCREMQVLYLDWEMGTDKFKRRCWNVARGLGLGRPPSVKYLDMRGRPLRQSIDYIQRAIEVAAADYLLIDSLSLAGIIGAEDALWANNELKTLGVTVSWQDHQARVQAGEAYEQKQAYGTRFKEAGVDSLWQLDPAEVAHHDKSKPELLLRDRKFREGPQRSQIGLRLTFLEHQVSFDHFDPAESPVLRQKLSGKEQTRLFIVEHDGCDWGDIEQALPFAKASIKKWVSALKAAGDIYAESQGGNSPDLLHAVSSSSPIIITQGGDDSLHEIITSSPPERHHLSSPNHHPESSPEAEPPVADLFGDQEEEQE